MHMFPAIEAAYVGKLLSSTPMSWALISLGYANVSPSLAGVAIIADNDTSVFQPVQIVNPQMNYLSERDLQETTPVSLVYSP
jgi:hypothetical protein